MSIVYGKGLKLNSSDLNKYFLLKVKNIHQNVPIGKQISVEVWIPKNLIVFKKTLVFTNYNHPVTDQCNASFSEWQMEIIHNRIDTTRKSFLD